MVVQCPDCQSRFRIADDKVTEKGVRVRCTACKNIFQVRKPGAATGPISAGSGTDPIQPGPPTGPVGRGGGTGPVGRPATGPIAAGPGQAMDLSSPPPKKPRTGPIQVPPRSTAHLPPPRKADHEDLFGMAELTGEAPSRPPEPPPSDGLPSFDDIELEVADTAARPITKPQPDAPRPRGNTGPLEVATPREAEEPRRPTTDPFRDGAAAPRRTERKTGPVPRFAPPPVKPSSRDLLSGLAVAAACVALALLAFAATALTPDGAPAGGSDRLVATTVGSGFFPTASGKPVFYVRGFVENHGSEAVGPVRVVAELAGDSGVTARGEAVAGRAPTPEEVFALGSQADAGKLSPALDGRSAERRVQPGASLPFVALIAEAPPSLRGQRLHVRAEPIDDKAAAPRKR